MDEVDPNRHFPGANLKTAAKLKILDWYLKEYVNIMEQNWDEYWYIDTHAGTGKTLCSNGTLINGSAARVLDRYAENFDRFYFYELNPASFETLHETLSYEFGYEFDVSPAKVEGVDFDIARCDNPRIRIMNTDSNEGVQFLAEEAKSWPHWFTFIDPKGLTARRATLDTLIERGNMDILINYQTSGVMRNAALGADHGTEAVTRVLGDDDWPVDGDEDEYVECFKNRLEENEEWEVRTKNMTDPFDKTYRFDLAFAAAHPVAHRIMRHIMEVRDDLWEEASKELGQSGFGDFT